MNSTKNLNRLSIILTMFLTGVVFAADQGMMGGPGHGPDNHKNYMNHMSQMMQDLSSHMGTMGKAMAQGGKCHENCPEQQRKNMAGMMDMMSMMMKNMSEMMSKNTVMDETMQKRMTEMHQQMETMKKDMMK